MQYGDYDLGPDYGELEEIGFGQQKLMENKESREVYYSGGYKIKPQFKEEEDHEYPF